MSATRVPEAFEHIERMLYGSRVGKPREITMSELIRYDESGFGFGFRHIMAPFTKLFLTPEEVLRGFLVRVNGPVHLRRAAKLTFRDAVLGEVRTRKEFVRRLNTHFLRPHPMLQGGGAASVRQIDQYAPSGGGTGGLPRRCV